MTTTKETVLEKHYSLDEIAKHLSLGRDKIRRMFRGESGVIEIPSDTGKQVTVRIPESVMQRVIRGMKK